MNTQTGRADMSTQTDMRPVQSPTAMLQRYAGVREHSVALAAPLSEEDCCVQSMPDASPVKWHLAHVTWFFETFILERFAPDFQPYRPEFRMLFNSYYNGVGEKYPRPQRGLLTRPALSEILDYRRTVDARMRGLLSAAELAPEVLPLVELGLHHEQQHQELMLTDIKHLLAQNPLFPAYAPPPAPTTPAVPPLGWLPHEGGVVEIGHAGAGFCFDNELPHHRQFIEPFRFASRLVSNGEYLAFVEDGGYANPALWLAEGWDWVQAGRLCHPLYWHAPQAQGAAGWQEFTLHGLQFLDLHAPASHLSYFEADAYARWAGARLPTEAEWEVAARREGPAQMFGACWQWTASSYAPYAGYAPAAGAVGEYNGKFMVNQYVLRGSSCATPPGHARSTYRNFFPASARWQFTGIRLAHSCCHAGRGSRQR